MTNDEGWNRFALPYLLELKSIEYLNLTFIIQYSTFDICKCFSPNPDNPKITNYKHQILSKIERQLFGILNLGHCDLPFDFAQGGEVVSLSNHLLFVFCYLRFLLLKPEH